MVVYTRSNNGDGIIGFGELEECFAFGVCGGEIGGVYIGWVVVKSSEKIIVVA
jgi:hypothetical protein